MKSLTWSEQKAWNFVEPYLRCGHRIEVTVTSVRPLRGVCVLVGPAAEGMQERVQAMSGPLLAALESGCVWVRRSIKQEQSDTRDKR